MGEFPPFSVGMWQIRIEVNNGVQITELFRPQRCAKLGCVGEVRSTL